MTIFTSELSIVNNQLKSSSGLKEFQWVWVVWAYCCVGTCLVSVQTFITDLHSGLQSYHWSVQFSSVRQLYHQSVNYIKLPISNAEVCGTPNNILLLFVFLLNKNGRRREDLDHKNREKISGVVCLKNRLWWNPVRLFTGIKDSTKDLTRIWWEFIFNL